MAERRRLGAHPDSRERSLEASRICPRLANKRAAFRVEKTAMHRLLEYEEAGKMVMEVLRHLLGSEDERRAKTATHRLLELVGAQIKMIAMHRHLEHAGRLATRRRTGGIEVEEDRKGKALHLLHHALVKKIGLP